MRKIFVFFVMLVLMASMIGSVEAYVFTFQAGNMDGFDLPADPASPSAALVTSVGANTDHSQSNLLQNFQDFDLIANVNGGTSNTAVGHTFTGLPTGITSASLTFSVQAGDDPYLASDQILFSFVEHATDVWVDTLAWYRPFGPRDYQEYVNNQWNLLYHDPGLLDSWDIGDQALFTFDLAALPFFTQNGTPIMIDLIPALNHYGFLDIIVEDETGVDYFSLSVTAAPLPPSIICLATGLLGLLGIKKRLNYKSKT